MRWPRSLFARLLAIGTLATAAALLVAAVAIGQVLERFVMHGFDQQLDAQIGAVTRGIAPSGRLDPARIASLPVFASPDPGWGWQVDGPGDAHSGRGQQIDPALLEGPPGPPPPIAPLAPPPPDAPRIRPGEADARSGEPVHFRTTTVTTAAGPVRVTASGPRQIAIAPLREAMVPLLASLAVLGLALVLATLVQLWLGLRPLRAIRASLAGVREGRLSRVPGGQPSELVPLVTEVNALLDQNEAGLANARRHVANLAHGLKTPLAALALKVAESGRDPDGALADLVARIDRHVRHHLARARAGGAEAAQARTPVADAVAALRDVLDRLHADRTIVAAVDVAADLVVAVDAQDLDEMLGNLLDNAWRHAAGRVAIAAARAGKTIAFVIEDDGPGVPDALLADALAPGRRLDERGDGHGFGLPIARELAEMSGGTLALDRSPALGGLRVTLRLPARM